MKLKAEGQRLVTLELASGAVAAWEETVWKELSEPLGREVRLEAFHAAVDEACSRHERFDAALDSWLAARLHRALPLTRREAAEIGVWRWLAAVARPDFVRHRWENVAWAQTRSRFVRPGTRPDSNALARLWWIAELCREGDDYALAERVLRRQTLANAIFIRSLSFYRPAIAACAEVLEEAQGEQIERALLELNRWLSVTVLEGLTEAELVAALRKSVA
jgi:hypothetical protein